MKINRRLFPSTIMSFLSAPATGWNRRGKLSRCQTYVPLVSTHRTTKMKKVLFSGRFQEYWGGAGKD